MSSTKLIHLWSEVFIAYWDFYFNPSPKFPVLSPKGDFIQILILYPLWPFWLCDLWNYCGDAGQSIIAWRKDCCMLFSAEHDQEPTACSILNLHVHCIQSSTITVFITHLLISYDFFVCSCICVCACVGAHGYICRSMWVYIFMKAGGEAQVLLLRYCLACFLR